MKNIKKLLTIVTTISLGLGLSACNAAGINSTTSNTSVNVTGTQTYTYNIKRTDDLTSFAVASATCTKTTYNGTSATIACDGDVPEALSTMIRDGNNAKSYSYTLNTTVNGKDKAVTFIATR